MYCERPRAYAYNRRHPFIIESFSHPLPVPGRHKAGFQGERIIFGVRGLLIPRKESL